MTALADATDNGCVLEKSAPVRVSQVKDGETVVLEDGREVRLIGILTKNFLGRDRDAGSAKAKDTLHGLVGGKSIILGFSGRRVDRYGRVLAHIFSAEGDELWIQGAMLQAGLALSYVLPGNFACIEEMLSHEDLARGNRVGLWSNATAMPRPAWKAGALMALRNSYQIVEGRVRDVAVTKSSVFLNFGDNWREDFTAGVSLSVAKSMPGWLDELNSLKGQRVEVRGWIERRNGPFIEIMHKAQIKRIDTAGGSAENGQPPFSNSLEPSQLTKPDQAVPDVENKKEKRPDQPGPGALDL